MLKPSLQKQCYLLEQGTILFVHWAIVQILIKLFVFRLTITNAFAHLDTMGKTAARTSMSVWAIPVSLGRRVSMLLLISLAYASMEWRVDTARRISMTVNHSRVSMAASVRTNWADSIVIVLLPDTMESYAKWILTSVFHRHVKMVLFAWIRLTIIRLVIDIKMVLFQSHEFVIFLQLFCYFISATVILVILAKTAKLILMNARAHHANTMANVCKDRTGHCTRYQTDIPCHQYFLSHFLMKMPAGMFTWFS